MSEKAVVEKLIGIVDEMITLLPEKVDEQGYPVPGAKDQLRQALTQLKQEAEGAREQLDKELEAFKQSVVETSKATTPAKRGRPRKGAK